MMPPNPRPVPKVRAITCPNCGGGVELRGLGASAHAACINCLSVLDVRHPEIEVVQRFQKAERFTPLIPLGQRGKLKGKEYEVIGYQVRAIFVDGERYAWNEYVLYNPYHGFRYLSEYQGHWTYIEPMPYLAQISAGFGPEAKSQGVTYKLFQTAQVKTIYVMGEFPWRVLVGETVTGKDYTAAPLSLSEEISGTEVNWSRGEYISGQEIWAAFQPPGRPPEPKGIYFNQPNPYPGAGKMWLTSGFFTLALLVLMVATLIFSRNEKVYQNTYTFTPDAKEASFVTPSFELKGGEDNVEIELATNLSNSWAYFDFALINEQTGTAYNIGKEVSFYEGRDSDGYWSEGGRDDKIRLGSVPAGRYYLRVEPESAKAPTGVFTVSRSVQYTLSVIRGKPVIWPYLLAIPFLWILPMLSGVRRASFEGARWAEADPQGTGAYAGNDNEEE